VVLLVAAIMVAVSFAAVAQAGVRHSGPGIRVQAFDACTVQRNGCKEACWIALGPDRPKGHCFELCWFEYQKCLAGGL